MPEYIYDYLIVGGGLAGASAVEGIRERDEEGSILMIGNEPHKPYYRPPLSKKLWFGKKKVEDIFVKDDDFYLVNNVDMALGVEVNHLDAEGRIVKDSRGSEYGYGKLLLATGGIPRKLSIPGGALEGIYYYRDLDHYLRLRQDATEGKSAIVIGGGFIGSEMAAALNLNKLNVTMIFPEAFPLSRIAPEGLGKAIQENYIRRGVGMLHGDAPTAFEKSGGKYLTRTQNGKAVESDIVVVGVGIDPAIGLTEMAGLALDNGILVNDRLQTSDPRVYAAGDIANFPYSAIGKRVRIEHWDNAINQGKHAGLNMAGADEPYTYMPYLFSDLFDFGFEAVGDVDARLETSADWQKENDTGVIYYLRDGKIKGAMMCNMWDKVDAAREIIRTGKVLAGSTGLIESS